MNGPRWVRLVLAAAVAGVLTLAGTGPAGADPQTDKAQVDRELVQAQATYESASEAANAAVAAYNEATQRLSIAQNALADAKGVVAARQAEAAQADRAAASARAAQDVRSLLAHGKAREAELWTRRAEAAGDSPEARHARLLLRLVSTRMDRDPEIPLAPTEPLAPPVVPHKLAAAHPEYLTRVADEYRDVLADVGARRYATAYKLLDKWPEPLWTGLGQDFALLSGFLDYKAEFYSDAVDTLKPLADDAAYVARRPEVLYYLGRAHYASAAYGKAVDALERFVRSQRVLGRPLLPASDPASASTVEAPPPAPL